MNHNDGRTGADVPTGQVWHSQKLPVLWGTRKTQWPGHGDLSPHSALASAQHWAFHPHVFISVSQSVERGSWTRFLRPP